MIHKRKHFDVEQIKVAAEGRWEDVFVSLAGVDPALLDGKPHGCPMCNEGKDRFRFIDKEAGALYCNQCFSERNGDGISSLMWLTGWKFTEACERLTDYLSISNGTYRRGSNGATSTKKRSAKPIRDFSGAHDTYRAKCRPDQLAALAGQLNVGTDSLELIGIGWDEKQYTWPEAGWINGRRQIIGIGTRGNRGGKKMLTGSHRGIIVPRDLKNFPGPILLVEGMSCVAACLTLMLPAIGRPMAKSPQLATEALTALSEKVSDRKFLIIAENDDNHAGREGAIDTAQKLANATGRSIRWAFVPDGTKDVRSWLIARGIDPSDKTACAAAGRELLAALEESAQTVEPSAQDDDEEGLVKLLADAICEDYHFARDAGGKLYVYQGGVYSIRGESKIKERVKRLCMSWGSTKRWKPALADHVIEWIRVDAPELWECPPRDVLNVKNGLLRVRDRKLLPHDPGHLAAVQLPVEFRPDATCPQTDEFIRQVFAADAVDLAYEIAAWLALPNMNVQKAVLLTGEGSNGKSTWLSQLVAFLGKRNCAAVSLHKLESDRFAVARLIGKLANICPDLPSQHLESTSTFKAITGGDVIPAERKYADSFEFTPFCRLIFSANHPPRSGDGSHAFFRRWLVVPFDRTFSDDEAIPREVLDARLSDPAELSGLLNRALDALPGLRERNDFSQPASVREALDDFYATTDPLAVWLDRHTVAEPDAVVLIADLRDAYNRDASKAGRPTLGNRAFGLAIRRLRPQVQVQQRTIGGRHHQKCYVGLGLRSESNEPDEPNDSYLLFNRGKSDSEGGVNNERQEKSNKRDLSGSSGSSGSPADDDPNWHNIMEEYH